jgi:hypothetical protein
MSKNISFLVLEITNNTWKLGPIMCDIWTSTDVLLCTSSILNFLVISIDRYCIINHPFKYAPMRKVKLLSLMIAGVWILSALVSLPPILGWGRTYLISIFFFLKFNYRKISFRSIKKSSYLSSKSTIRLSNICNNAFILHSPYCCINNLW